MELQFLDRETTNLIRLVLAWAVLHLIDLLILPESPELVWPLILSLSLGDPFLGKFAKRPQPKSVFMWGSIFIALIWVACFYYYSQWMALVMGLCSSEWGGDGLMIMLQCF